MIAAVFVLPISASAYADASQFGRYMTMSNQLTSSQVDLLSQTVQIRFPQSVVTVGDAMNYMLKFSGYALISMNKMNPALETTLSKPLPVVDREIGPVRLKDGLTTLAGPSFYLLHDPVNRIVDFKLKPAYQKLYQKKIKANKRTSL